MFVVGVRVTVGVGRVLVVTLGKLLVSPVTLTTLVLFGVSLPPAGWLLPCCLCELAPRDLL